MADEVLYRIEEFSQVTKTRRGLDRRDVDRRRITGATHFATELEAWNAIVKIHSDRVAQAVTKLRHENRQLSNVTKSRDDVIIKQLVMKSADDV